MQPSEPLVSSRQPITTADRRLALLVAAVVLFSSVFLWRNYWAAFPQASLDLRLSRAEITAQAEQFLKSRGLDPGGFRHLTLFDPDDNSRLYLEREAGLEETNRLLQGQVPVWKWRARWYRPPDKEERVVQLSPEGRLIAFEHIIAESTGGARLSADAARGMAQSFLEQQSKLPHHLVEEKQEQRPNRLDYVFTWEQDGFRVHEATLRRTVVIQGGEVGSYLEFLYVPEQWWRGFAALRSKNELYSQIAQAFYVPLVLAGLGLIIQGMRRHTLLWRPLLGVSAVVGALMVLNQINALPFFLDNVPTSSSYAQGLTLGFLQALGAGVGVFFYILLAAVPGELLYRERLPDKLSLRAAFGRHGFETREFFRASLAGYGMAAGHIAFVVAFYLVGRRFGVWSPQDVAYSDLLSTSIPWIYPLTIALMAACSEEFWFRLLGVPLIERLVRWRVAAIVIPAFIWGFLHANYPQQPGYIRGVEVGLIGIVAGVVMLRFGILATLVWHYTVDASLIGAFLMQSSSWYFRLSGAAVAGAVLFPLVASVWSYQRRGGFLVAEGMTNAAIAPPPEPPAEVHEEKLPPLRPSWNPRLAHFTAAILFGAAMLVHPIRFGDFLHLNVTREQALAIAGAAPADWMQVADFLPNLDTATFEYLRRNAGSEAASRAVEQHTFTGVWRVRRFRPQEKEEWRYFINQQGRLFRTDHILDEKAPGANLSPGDALSLVVRYLTEKQGIDIARYKLVDSSHRKLDHRTDHSFVWERDDFRIGAATARLSLNVVGDEPSEFRKFIKLPEEWLREFRKPRLQNYVLPAFVGAVGVFIIIVFLRRLGGHPFHWARYLTAAGALLAVYIAQFANDWPGFYSNYDTATPLQDFSSDALLGFFMRALLLAFAAGVGVLMVEVFLRMVQGNRALPKPSWVNMLAIAGLWWGWSRLTAGLEQKLPGDRLTLPLWNVEGTSSWWPSLDILTSSTAFAFGVTIAVTVGVAAFLVMEQRQRLTWIVAGVAAMAVARANDPLLVLFYIATGLITVGLVVMLLQTFAGDLFSLAGAAFLATGVSRAVDLLSQPNPLVRTQGAVALAGALLMAGVWMVRWRRLP